MELTQLANLGEFIGGVAVLVTLIYLAVQLRLANVLAKADAFHKSTAMLSTWRRMVSEEGINEVWVKALDDDDLSPQEEQRLYRVLCELTYAAVATLRNEQAVSGFHRTQQYLDLAPRAVARELRSAVLRKTWARVADDCAAWGLGEFADSVSDLARTQEAHS